MHAALVNGVSRYMKTLQELAESIRQIYYYIDPHSAVKHPELPRLLSDHEPLSSNLRGNFQVEVRVFWGEQTVGGKGDYTIPVGLSRDLK